MRTTTRIAGTALAMIGALTLTACNDHSATASGPTTKPKSSATSAAPFPAAGHQAVQCGTGPWGLAVVASTAHGDDFCPTALSVVTAYAADRANQSSGDIAVTVDTIRWVCGERQGDPNPYQECASQNESADKVRLLS
ncbi:hypothetical protein D7D52_35280 [Nocardia yunnanensis]|uniref:Uncharacterized protein n=1 Tax=Nocardia yunnanensis TaxID=2382165 RepID=A0A386ZM28_9NOCA|nr:hypothetical protein [Nocardia yunnanensis]AYF78224.1 hypothetical protein D7D52_35280 [Nocardia yunnanensis]